MLEALGRHGPEVGQHFGARHRPHRLHPLLVARSDGVLKVVSRKLHIRGRLTPQHPLRPDDVGQIVLDGPSRTPARRGPVTLGQALGPVGPLSPDFGQPAKDVVAVQFDVHVAPGIGEFLLW